MRSQVHPKENIDIVCAGRLQASKTSYSANVCRSYKHHHHYQHHHPACGTVAVSSEFHGMMRRNMQHVPSTWLKGQLQAWQPQTGVPAYKNMSLETQASVSRVSILSRTLSPSLEPMVMSRDPDNPKNQDLLHFSKILTTRKP